jgi:hypothetical protein
VRDGQVFGHAIAFVDRQAELAIPGQQGHRHRRRTAHRDAAPVQTQRLEHLAPHQAAGNRDRQQAFEPGRRQLLVYAALELDPQARHREKDGRAGALQVGHEGLHRFGKVHAHAGVQPAMLDQHALELRDAARKAMADALAETTLDS